MGLIKPRRILHLMNLDDADADTVGRMLRHGDATEFLDEAGNRCTQVEGEMEIERDGRRETVRVRRTLDAHGALITEHADGRQDVVVRPQPVGGGVEQVPPEPG